METQIKALETLYSGTRFRSRTEARWAVFFDAMGLRWQYEPEGYDLGDGLWYLPDFFLPDLDMFVEVKPPRLAGTGWPSGDAFDKMHGLQRLFTGEYGLVKIVMLCGAPGFISMSGFYSEGNPYEGFIVGDEKYFWCECAGCGSVNVQFEGRAGRNTHTPTCKCHDRDEINLDSPRLLAAYEAACSARFERPI